MVWIQWPRKQDREKIMNKRFISVFITLVTAVAIVALFMGCKKRESPSLLRIGITQIATHPGIDAIRAGFIEEMARLGYTDGKNIVYEQSNAQGEMTMAQSIAQKLVQEKCRLIFAISTPSSQAVAQAIKGTEIPLVFGAVTDPVAAGLVESMEKPGRNITGTSDQWPVKDQFDLLLRLVPKVKRVGLVYNPGEANAEANIKVVEKACHEKGLDVVKVSVSNTSEVQTAAASLVGRCDAFYVPADNTVIAAMDAVIRVSEQNKIPLLPGVSSNVEQGGFGTLGPDYHDIGIESAKLAAQVLQGKRAGEIPVATATRFEYFFNLRSAKATGIEIPPDLIEKAAKVYR
jgi:putative ABC transport system substrate-binding protein